MNKKIKFFLFFLSFIIPLYAENVSFKNLSLKQQKFLYDTYQLAKNTKYKWTLTAIAWKETEAGIAQMNIFDGGKRNAACGRFHSLLSSVFKRHPEWIPTNFNKNKICTKLILDNNFALQEALNELNYWYKKMKGNWFNIWAAYNAGWSYKTKGKKYAYSIYLRIKQLKKYVGNKWNGNFKYIK